MSNITIGRYDGCSQTTPEGVESPLTDTWSGWIEGITDDGSSWITYLDGSGRPVLHWPAREESGAVIGEPVEL